MEKLIILNGSPRAPRSNSKQYAALFAEHYPVKTEYCEIRRNNHLQLCEAVDTATKLLFVFPLYADSLPVTLLNFLKTLEQHPPRQKPIVSVLVNCGFLEPRQNDVAVEMMQLFCSENGYPFGSVLKVGSGEAILTTPFAGLVRRKMKRFARAVAENGNQTFSVTMPLPKRLFLRASTAYWTEYGKKNGVTKEEMQRMQIE